MLVTNYPVRPRTNSGETSLEMSLDTMKVLVGGENTVSSENGKIFLTGSTSTFVVTSITEDAIIWNCFDKPAGSPFSPWDRELDTIKCDIRQGFDLENNAKDCRHVLEWYDIFHHWGMSAPVL